MHVIHIPISEKFEVHLRIEEITVVMMALLILFLILVGMPNYSILNMILAVSL